MASDGPTHEHIGRSVASASPARVRTRGSEIVSVDVVESSDPGELPWIGPGLVDLQINGFAGFELNADELSDTAAEGLIAALHRTGTLRFLPTVVTAAPEAIETRLRRIATLRETLNSWSLSAPGVHLEGPFISPAGGPRGAHPEQWVRPPDWELFRRWQDAAGGAIKIVTLSPEWPEAPRFIERATESGVVVAIGHTAADSDQISEAVAAGATLVTHFGNGVHPTLPRHPNYLWDQLAADALAVTLIADGFHLPVAVLKTTIRVKGERAMLVSDSVALAGLPSGVYESPIGDRVVLTPAGRLHLEADPRLLAGSASPLIRGVEHLVAAGVVGLAEAWSMASMRPAALLGLPGGELEPGGPADFILFDLADGKITIRTIVKAGENITCGQGR